MTIGFPWRRQWHPTPVLLPGKSHGQRSLVGCSPWGRWGSDTTERLHFHFSLSCIGEGNGNPLQCSCLESLRDGGAWWAAVYGVAQSRTRLKRLSSSRTAAHQAPPSMGFSRQEYWNGVPSPSPLGKGKGNTQENIKSIIHHVWNIIKRYRICKEAGKYNPK